MARGRKPTPTQIKRLRGNPGKRPGNSREPDVQRGFPKRPPHIKGEARREWNRICQELDNMKLLHPELRPSLILYCDTYGRFIEARKALEQTGMLIKTSNGNLVQNPLIGIVNRTSEQLRKMLSEFGIPPTARTRVESILDVQTDAFAQFMDDPADVIPMTEASG